MQYRNRVHAYITHENRLLVFEHVNSDAGIQVPAGTVEADEAPELAVMREASEETGLTDLTLQSKLGDFEHDMREFGVEEIQHAWFYHLACDETPPDRWDRDETGGGTADPIRFRLYWVSLPDGVPRLHNLQGAMLGELHHRLVVQHH